MSNISSQLLPTTRDDKNIISNTTDSVNQQENITDNIMDLDKISLLSNLLAIIILIFIWKKLNLFSIAKTNRYLLLIFIAQIFFFIAQINYGELSITSLPEEQTFLSSVEQLASIMIGSLILFLVFFKNINTIEKTIIIISIIINSMVLLFISSHKKNISSLRKIRRFKQAGLTLSIFLFITSLVLMLQHIVK